ncbi:hypothetical protein CANMA_003124 [Candida margitis]|uniref:uncharacterized protein n=1 Tax=Candida margitis TaxID=1775924 RepID=UPI0022262458|nr:uncharacterized protein CANMA_003124 [Candida margitis]KAI5967304.1 hypothetical protein CANMA_003124 [Candida margitis]
MTLEVVSVLSILSSWRWSEERHIIIFGDQCMHHAFLHNTGIREVSKMLTTRTCLRSLSQPNRVSGPSIRCLSHTTKPVSNKKLYDKPKTKSKEERKIFGRLKETTTSETETNPSASTSAAVLASTAQPPQYLPTSALPQMPKHLQDQSFESIYESLGQKHILDRINEPKGIDLIIPREFIKPPQPPKRHVRPEKTKDLDKKIKNFIAGEHDDRSLIHLGKEISAHMEPDHNEIYPILEHPLKKSLSGLKTLNPAMNKIKDQFLWDVIPEDNMAFVPPYQVDNPLGFKKWEQELIAERERAKREQDSILKELQEFDKLMGDSKSFFGKNQTNDSQGGDNSEDASDGSGAKGSRRKLNRKLLKKYKKLKDEGKIDVD